MNPHTETLVSVIIPIYKVEPYLLRCVSSVRKQTYKHLEIILVDDGSPDNCPAICDQLAREDNRIVVIHKENQGLGMARNSGIDIARGEWLCFVDSDDFIASRYVELMLAAAVENGCMTVQCKLEKGINTFLSEPKNHEPIVHTLDLNGYISYCRTTPGHSICPVWQNIYHRSMFEDIRFPLLKHTEDMPVAAQIMKKSSTKPFAVVDECMYYWFQRADSIMNQKTTLNILDQSKAFEWVISFWNNEKHPDIADMYWPIYFKELITGYTNLMRDLPESNKDYEFLREKIVNNLEKANYLCHEDLMLPPNPAEIVSTLLNGQEIILYGYGNNGRYALPWLQYFEIPVIEIWDRDAGESAKVNNIPLRRAHGNMRKDTTVIITVADYKVMFHVRSMLEKMGYMNLVQWSTLEIALRYAIYEKLLPFLIKK